ncbi:hypothetical protein [Pseudomonas sp. HLT2-19-2]
MSFTSTKIFRSPIFYCLLALITLLAISFELRKSEFSEPNGSQNLEATYHTLLTIKAISENPVAAHLYLPLISLGGTLDKGISWGATVPTKSGNYIYTSFSFPGFIAPYLWFKILPIEKSTTNLAYFNFMLGGVTSVLILILCYFLLRSTGYAQLTSSVASLSASLISIFSREALLSTGLTYWAHCLYQVILALSLLTVLKYLISPSGRTREVHLFSLLILTFCGALTEWTGYIFNAGLVLLFWFGAGGCRADRKMSFYIFISTGLAGIVTIAHLSAAIGLSPAINSLLHRFVDRSASTGSVTLLIYGYGLSYGLFLLLAVGISAISSFTRGHAQKSQLSGVLVFVFLAACIPLIENVVMLQHASAYTFDRLKFIFPATIIFSVCFANSRLLGRLGLIGALAIASYQGYCSYREDLARYAFWGEKDKSNRVLANKVIGASDQECTVYASNIAVRGYANLLFNHGIYEYKSSDNAAELLKARKGCALTYIEGEMILPDLPQYSKATITRANGETSVIKAD